MTFLFIYKFHIKAFIPNKYISAYLQLYSSVG